MPSVNRRQPGGANQSLAVFRGSTVPIRGPRHETLLVLLLVIVIASTGQGASTITIRITSTAQAPKTRRGRRISKKPSDLPADPISPRRRHAAPASYGARAPAIPAFRGASGVA